jgi:hypothetical protein
MLSIRHVAKYTQRDVRNERKVLTLPDYTPQFTNMNPLSVAAVEARVTSKGNVMLIGTRPYPLIPAYHVHLGPSLSTRLST